MGRGRAKAKQTKVARELKYHSPNTDLDALQRELAGSAGSTAAENGTGHSKGPDEQDQDEDPYARYSDEDGGDDASWAVRGS